MKILKTILIVIVVVIGIALITALFTKKEYGVEREIVINKPKQEVFDYLKLLKNQENFSVWAMRDPNAVSEYKGTDGTVGAIHSWDSKMKEVGKGEQEIIKIKEGDRIDTELRFKEPFEATDYAYFVTESGADNQTKVKWGFNGKMKYPMNLMLVFMDMETMLGGDLEKGLNNLKGVLEK